MLPELSQKLWQLQKGSFDDWTQLEHPLTGQTKKTKVKKQFKWATSLDSMFKMDFVKAESLQDLLEIQTLKTSLQVIGQEKSAAGSVGVFFVQTSDGVFVLKAASHSLASEIFATLVSLNFGVYSPRLILFRTGTDFGQQVLDAVSDKDPNHNTFGLYEQRYVMAMEYTPGCHVSNMPSLMGVSVVPFMTTLGKIIAMDVLLNNGDRVPFIWENQGNSNNLHLVTRYEGDELVADLANIDPSIVSIDSEKFPDEYADYIIKVDTVLATMVQFYNKPTADIPKVVVHLLKIVSMWSLTELVSSVNAVAFAEGFASIVKLFRADSVDDKVSKPLQQYYEYLQYVKNHTTTGDSEIVAAAESIGMNSVQMKFIGSMTKLFSKHAETIK